MNKHFTQKIKTIKLARKLFQAIHHKKFTEKNNTIYSEKEQNNVIKTDRSLGKDRDRIVTAEKRNTGIYALRIKRKLTLSRTRSMHKIMGQSHEGPQEKY